MVELDPEEWVDHYADALFGAALVQVKDEAVADDLVQETFMAGLTARHTFRGQAQERTWLMAILRNKVNDYFRAQTRRPTVSLDDAFYDGYFDRDDEGNFDHWLPGKSPADWGDTTEPDDSEALSAVLYACLAQLPPRYAQVITLKFLDTINPADICKELGISASNYWTLVHRVKILLRECLEKNWYSTR